MTSSVASPVARPRRVRSARARRGLVAWGFALPFVVVFLGFMAFPVVFSGYMSFTDIRARDLRTPLSVDFVGLDNFTRMFTDPNFLRAVRNTLYFVVVGMPLTLGIALVVAVLINSKIARFRTLHRVGYYVPYVTSIVAVAVVWKVLLQPDFGVANTVLGWFGIDGPAWLSSPVLAMPAIIVMTVWRNVGYSMVIFLAGLQSIPENLYEAAAIDGAGAARTFRSITVPMLRPTILLCAVLMGIGYLQFFEEPFVMTQGGPLRSTTSVAMEIYDEFGFGNYGYAAAMSWVLFAAIVLLSLVQFRLLGRRR